MVMIQQSTYLDLDGRKQLAYTEGRLFCVLCAGCSDSRFTTFCALDRSLAGNFYALCMINRRYYIIADPRNGATEAQKQGGGKPREEPENGVECGGEDPSPIYNFTTHEETSKTYGSLTSGTELTSRLPAVAPLSDMTPYFVVALHAQSLVSSWPYEFQAHRRWAGGGLRGQQRWDNCIGVT